jgi:hypothetical protein
MKVSGAERRFPFPKKGANGLVSRKKRKQK